jgi:hypothetical protein
MIGLICGVLVFTWLDGLILVLDYYWTSTIPVRCYGLILLKIGHEEFEYSKLAWLYESELPFKHMHHFIILPLSENKSLTFI